MVMLDGREIDGAAGGETSGMLRPELFAPVQISLKGLLA